MRHQFNGPDRLRDVRSVPVYFIERTITTDYLPLLGGVGHSLYVLYCCLAQQAGATPGLRRIARHLNCGTKTVSLYNRLLVWCDLIEIETGDSEFSNTYLLLNTPPMNEAALKNIRARAIDELDHILWAAPFLNIVLRRIDNYCGLWQPSLVQMPGGNGTEEEIVPTGIGIVDELKQAGFGEDKSIALSEAHDPDYLRGWIEWAEKQAVGYFKGSKTGYLLRCWAKADPVPVMPATAKRKCSYCQNMVELPKTICPDCLALMVRH